MDQTTTPKSPRTSYSRKFITAMKARAAERHLTNKTIMEAADISQSTFYRIINSELEYPVLSLDDAIYLSSFLDLSIDALFRPAVEVPSSNLPILDGPRDDIMENTQKMLAERKQEIDSLKSEAASLYTALSEKDERIAALDAETRDLHNRIHELNRDYAERLDKLHAELSQRTEQLLDLLLK